MFLFVRDVCLLWEEGALGIILLFWCLLFVMYCSFSGFFLKNIIRSNPALILGSLQ